jgi:DNA-binding LytR/AlgR family response regulator
MSKVRYVKTLIVDDEPIARRVLREELELFPEVEIAGEAASGKEALLKIAELRPDLVFLDLQMPVMNGFEVIQNLQTATPPAIVIVTAYDQHAIQAFEAGAIDYLLKPVRHERLAQAVERVRQVTGKDAIDKLARLQEIAGGGLEQGRRRIALAGIQDDAQQLAIRW